MNKKHGFTLSELLMSIAIIAVVSAMGITIAKRNTDDAYKTYFAVGTMNLNNALAQIESGNVNVRPNAAGDALEIRVDNNERFIPGEPSRNMFVSRDPFAPPPLFGNDEGSVYANDLRGLMWLTNNLKYLFGDSVPKLDNNEPGIVSAGNGIVYFIRRPNPFQNGGPVGGTVNISMTVPAPRKRVGNNIIDRARTDFLYARDAAHDGGEYTGFGNQHLLVPSSLRLNNWAVLPDFDNIQNRQDLLTAYIDDGAVGRHIQNRFTPIQYGTYRDAMCTILRHNSYISENGEERDDIFNYPATSRIVDCNEAFRDLSIDNNGNPRFPQSGVIKFASPRKLK